MPGRIPAQFIITLIDCDYALFSVSPWKYWVMLLWLRSACDALQNLERLRICKEGWGCEVPPADYAMTRDFLNNKRSYKTQCPFYSVEGQQIWPQIMLQADLFGRTSLRLPHLPFFEAFCPRGSRVNTLMLIPWGLSCTLTFLRWCLQLANLL